jgi:predicted component of type VI protein secretion system
LDNDDRLRRTQPPLHQGVDGAAAGAASLRFWLEYQGHNIELRPGNVLVGRSSSCHVVLDDALVSRRHAQFVVGPDVVKVEDFGSVNGVQVNSQRIGGVVTLKVGDRVQIGKQEMVLRATLRSPHPEPPERFTAETLHGMSLPGEVLAAMQPQRAQPKEPPARPEALDLLCGVADKVLALGRGEEAEKVLSSALSNLLVEARSSGVAPSSAARAAEYAVRLAEATARPKWVDYAFELYLALKRPLPAEVVDQLYQLLRKVSGINRAALHAYVEELRALQSGFGPAERFLVQRIEGLERLAALK